MNLYAAFKKMVGKYPDLVAVKMGVQQLSYLDLDKRSEVVAQYLLSKNVESNDLIGLALPRSIELIVSILAILRVGAAYVPIDLNNPRARIKLILKDSKPKYIVTRGAYKNIFSIYNNLCIEDVFTPRLLKPYPVVDEIFRAYVIYTSGTTGQPKGVVIPHGNVLALFESTSVQGFNFDCQDKWSLFHSYAFDFSVWEIWGALLNGACLVIAPDKITKNINLLFEFVKQEKITVLSLTPSVFKQLVLEHAHHKDKLKSLRYVVFGGERFDLNDLESWYRHYQEHIPELVNMYGITETTIHSSIKLLSRQDLVDKQQSPIGKPLHHLEFVLLDENNNKTKPQEVGEIYISGKGLALGYLNNPALTKEIFLRLDHVQKINNENIWYKTNDLAWQSDIGDFYYVGRCDGQVKFHGFRIELDEINSALMSHPKVLLASVLMYKLENSNDILIAFYRLRNYQEISQNKLEQYLKKRLPSYMLPSHWYEIQDIPLTQNGKIDNKKLIQSYKSLSSGIDNFLDSNIILNKTEKKISAIWKSVLGIKRVLTHSDNFFMLGGYSLLAGQVVARLKKQFQINISIKNILDYSTISALAKYIDDNYADLNLGQENIVKEVVGDMIPASASQQSLYYLFQVAPGAEYNVPFLISFNQKLKYECIKKAFERLVEQHESLRTSFVYGDNGIEQVISKNLSFDFSRVKIKKENLIQQYQQKSKEVFSLEKSPLFFVEYIEFTDENDSALFFNVHHIVFDGSSFNVFIDCLFANYLEFYEGRNNFKNQFVQYRYFSTAENEKLSFGKLMHNIEYWHQYLRGCNKLIQYPRPSKLSEFTEMNIVKRNIECIQAEKVKELCRKIGVTEFSVYLSAFYLCLFRHCCQFDITVGVPLANRNSVEYENIIGFLVNTLPFRMRIDDHAAIEDFIRSVNDLSFEMLSRQDVPLSEIVKWVDGCSGRMVQGSPLFDTIFVLQNSMTLNGQSHSFNYDVKNIYTNTAKFSLSVLCARDKNGNIECVFEYDVRRIDSQFLEIFSSDFVSVVNEVVCNLHVKIKLFLEQFEGERNIRLAQSNNTKKNINISSIVNLLDAAEKKYKNNNAIHFHNGSLSYQLLAELSNSVAAKIIKILGYNDSQDKIIGLYMDRCPEMVITIIGIIKSGYAYLPLYPDLPTARLEFIINDASPEIIISDRKHLSVLASDIVSYNDLLLINYDVTSLSHVLTSPSCLSYVMYTSGTTGWPKGIALSHQALLNRLCWMSSRYQLDSGDISIMKTPFNFDVSFGEIFLPLISGAGLYVADPEGHKDPYYLLDIMQANNITHIHFVPSMLNIFIELLESGISYNLSTLKIIFCSGEALLQSSVDKILQLVPGVKIYNQYGPTESGEVSDYQACAGEDAEIVPVGKPVWNTRFYVINQSGMELPVGIPGELYIAGDCLATEYLNSPELTDECFIRDHRFNHFETVLYKTKDLVMWRADGNLLYLGRLDKQIKIRGLRIEPGEIENNMLEHDAVSQAVVQLIKNPLVKNDPGNLVAFYVPSANKEVVGDKTLEAHLALTLPDYMIPKKFIALKSMPVTANGKVDTGLLPPVDFDCKDSSDAESISGQLPKTAVEREMAKLWSECLGIRVEHIFMLSDFFALGGHSILLIRLILLVEKSFKRKIKISEFITNPKLFCMCELVDGAKIKSASSYLVKLLGHDKGLVNEIKRPLLSCQEEDSVKVDGSNIETILLTGANGFLGLHLLQALLQRTNYQVICLVRAESNELAKVKLLQRIKEFCFNFSENFLNRINVYACDLNQAYFGLSEKDYADLSSRVKEVCHCAAKINHLYNYEQHREANVIAVKKIIEFSILARKKKIHFISTSAVSLLESGKENLSYQSLPVSSNGYVQSKWMGEYLLLQAKNKFDLEVNIFRPGHIGANGLSGAIDYQSNHLSLLWLGFVKHGVAPDWSGSLELVPVDLLADILVQLIKINTCNGASFNLVNPWRITWQECINIIALTAEKHIEIIPYNQWVAEYLANIDKSSPWYSLISLYELKTEGEGAIADVVDPVPNQVMENSIELENIYQLMINKQLSFCLNRWLV